MKIDKSPPQKKNFKFHLLPPPSPLCQSHKPQKKLTAEQLMARHLKSAELAACTKAKNVVFTPPAIVSPQKNLLTRTVSASY